MSCDKKTINQLEKKTINFLMNANRINKEKFFHETKNIAIINSHLIACVCLWSNENVTKSKLQFW